MILNLEDKFSKIFIKASLTCSSVVISSNFTPSLYTPTKSGVDKETTKISIFSMQIPFDTLLEVHHLELRSRSFSHRTSKQELICDLEQRRPKQA